MSNFLGAISFFVLLVIDSICWAQPYPQSEAITDITLDWSTHRRFAPGSDNFQLTWADDDHLYGAWGDGGGFGGTNRLGRVGLGVTRIEGSADSYRGFNVWGGHEAEHPATFDGKSWGMISTGGSLFMWVVPDVPDGKTYRNHYEFIELAQSSDHGATWTKAPWKFTESENITIPTFLNLEQDNSGVPEEFGDYVYSYFIRPQNPTMEQEGPQGVGLIVHKPGVLYLARVRSAELLRDKSAYEFLCGYDAEKNPLWGSLNEKHPVFEDLNGVGWCMSASYHSGLKRVLLCTEHGESKRGLIGIFDSPTPWGPWTTIKYHEPTKPFGAQRPGSELDWKNNVFFVAFPTKWMNGYTFTMNFTGAGQGKDNDSFNTVSGRFHVR